MANFDPNDRRSWYFGPISRGEATEVLMAEKDGGVFLVRDSSSIPGDYVLCVKEDSKVCHYIINKIGDGDGSGVGCGSVSEGVASRYRIGDRSFPSLPALLSFYKLHYLDTTPLTRPAAPRPLRVIAKHDFEGRDPEDLPFKKGEVLTIIRKDEDQWWTARNGIGRLGAIPVPYIRPLPPEDGTNSHAPSLTTIPPGDEAVLPLEENGSVPGNGSVPVAVPSPLRKLLPQGTADSGGGKETWARVVQARVPNAYDDTALKLEVGEVIKVTKINISGQWEGVLTSANPPKKGHFPFTHVELIEGDPNSVEVEGGT